MPCPELVTAWGRRCPALSILGARVLELAGRAPVVWRGGRRDQFPCSGRSIFFMLEPSEPHPCPWVTVPSGVHRSQRRTAGWAWCHTHACSEAGFSVGRECGVFELWVSWLAAWGRPPPSLETAGLEIAPECPTCCLPEDSPFLRSLGDLHCPPCPPLSMVRAPESASNPPELVRRCDLSSLVWNMDPRCLVPRWFCFISDSVGNSLSRSASSKWGT